MIKKVCVLLLSMMIAVGFVTWWRDGLTRATAESSTNPPAPQRGEPQKWEYCAITEIAYLSDSGLNRRYRVTIVYSRDSNARPEQVELEPTANPLFVTLDRLGRAGWELVGTQDNAGFAGYSAGGIFFKRPRP